MAPAALLLAKQAVICVTLIGQRVFCPFGGGRHRILILGFTAALLVLGFSTEATQLKVMTYNMHHGKGLDGVIDLPGIADVIRQAGADIVGLQEVDQKTARSFYIDQAQVLGEILGYHHTFTPHFPYMGGNYGLALMSRYPITSARSLPLPTKPGREAKSILCATLDIAGEAVDVFVVHFEVNDAALREEQSAAAAAIVASSPRPALLMGDLNQTADSAVGIPLRYFMLDTYVAARFLLPSVHMDQDPPLQRTYTGGGATWPVEDPVRRADIIWNTWQWRPSSGEPVRTIASPKSDHRAVLASLEILESQPGLAFKAPTTWSEAGFAALLLPEAAVTWFKQNGVDSALLFQAVGNWLEAIEMPLQVVSSTKDLPPGGVIILPGGRFLDAREAGLLREYVGAGGALVAWGDVGVEDPYECDSPAADILAQTLGIDYVGWSYGYPTRGKIQRSKEAVEWPDGVPETLEFWRLSGPIVRVLPGAERLGVWWADREDRPSHPDEINAALVKNGRAMYLSFDPVHLRDPDNPDMRTLVTGIVQHLSARRP